MELGGVRWHLEKEKRETRSANMFNSSHRRQDVLHACYLELDIVEQFVDEWQSRVAGQLVEVIFQVIGTRYSDCVSVHLDSGTIHGV